MRTIRSGRTIRCVRSWHSDTHRGATASRRVRRVGRTGAWRRLNVSLLPVTHASTAPFRLGTAGTSCHRECSRHTSFHSNLGDPRVVEAELRRLLQWEIVRVAGPTPQFCHQALAGSVAPGLVVTCEVGYRSSSSLVDV